MCTKIIAVSATISATNAQKHTCQTAIRSRRSPDAQYSRGVGQAVTEPGADREQRGSDGDVTHGLREQPVGPTVGRRARLLIAMGVGS